MNKKCTVSHLSEVAMKETGTKKRCLGDELEKLDVIITVHSHVDAHHELDGLRFA